MFLQQASLHSGVCILFGKVSRLSVKMLGMYLSLNYFNMSKEYKECTWDIEETVETVNCLIWCV